VKLGRYTGLVATGGGALLAALALLGWVPMPAAMVGLVLTLAALAWREWRLRSQLQLCTEGVEALDQAVLLFDANDRLRYVSQALLRLYPELAQEVHLGQSHADVALKAARSASGGGAAGVDKAWLAARLTARQGPGDEWQHRLTDGRTLQVTERRTRSGGWISLRTDLTEHLAGRMALSDASDAARMANALLDEALEAFPAGFEIWSPDNKLVRFNRRVAEFHPRAAEWLKPGVDFEAVCRQMLNQGLVLAAKGREVAWLSERLSQRGKLGRPILLQETDGRWVQVQEQRMPSGYLVAVRQDVSELVGARRALGQAKAKAEHDQLLLRRALDALPVGLELYDENDKLLLANRQFRSWMPDVDYDALIGKSFEHAVRVSQRLGRLPLGAQADEEAWIAHRVASHGRNPEPLRVQLPDGRVLLTQETRTPEGYTVTVRQDLTAWSHQEQEVAASEAQLQALIQTAGVAIVTLDAQARMLSLNEAAQTLWGYEAREVVGQSAALLLGRADAEAMGQLLRAHVAGRAPGFVGSRSEMQGVRKDGAPLVLQAAVSEVRAAGEHFFVAVVTDITEQRRAEAQLQAANGRLEQLSSTDDLTGLANRRALMAHLQQLWLHALRDHKPLALVLIDVDFFKRYNDHHGHQAGDGALRAVADLLRATGRRATDLAARYGGEEFVLLLDHCDLDAALVRAEQLRQALADKALPHGNAPLGRLSVSIGVHSGVPHRDLRPGQWVAKADEALYRAKAEGRDRVLASAPERLVVSGTTAPKAS
jgi:diguanylate cyclase (GGDEF)-like protein/PAS domain S-box-containing protein